MCWQHDTSSLLSRSRNRFLISVCVQLQVKNCCFRMSQCGVISADIFLNSVCPKEKGRIRLLALFPWRIPHNLNMWHYAVCVWECASVRTAVFKSANVVSWNVCIHTCDPQASPCGPRVGWSWPALLYMAEGLGYKFTSGMTVCWWSLALDDAW